MAKRDTRGIRNNNPGNIRRSMDKWQGLAPTQNDPAFFEFKDPVYGIRAIAVLLTAYQDRYDCKTPRDFIVRYAPPGDHNPTDVYAATVARCIGVPVNANIDVHEYAAMRGMIEGIIEQENGAPWNTFYSNAQIDKALLMAGIAPKPKPVAASKTVVGASTTGTAVVASTALQQVQDQLVAIVPYADVLKWVFLALALAGIGLTLYAKWDERRKGVS